MADTTGQRSLDEGKDLTRGAASGGVAADSAAPRHVYRQTFDEVCQCGKSYWIKDGRCTVCKQERAGE
jgi:hypothetical protein